MAGYLYDPTPARQPLSEKQELVLDFIVERVARVGRWPTQIEIARHMGWKSPSSARDAVERLVAKGHVRRKTYRWFQGALDDRYELIQETEDADCET